MTTSGSPSILLVGAGVAGISAALWLEDFRISFDWVDSTGEVGGMLSRVNNSIENYPGGLFDNGPELADTMAAHLRKFDLWPRDAQVEHIEYNDGEVMGVVDGKQRHYELVILATGTTYRRLGVPGEEEGQGKWISQSAMADAPRFANEHVAVVGGGDSGFENARILAEAGCRVTMLLRSQEFRARTDFVDAVRDNEHIAIAPIPSRIERIEARDDGCRLFVDQQGSNVTVDVAALFVRIGVDPVLPGGCAGLDCDNSGFLLVDDQGWTSHRRVLAAGDITSIPLRSVATSVGHGAVVARTCATFLDI